MDKTLKYQAAIKTVIQSYIEYYYKESPLRIQTIFDDNNGHYILIHLGWQDDQWTYGIPLHLDIIADKIWIQRNQTEVELEEELLELGVLEEDMIIGFYTTDMAKVQC
ncbi:MAG: element excision factor XisI family protein [Bacteroidota bacterium]